MMDTMINAYRNRELHRAQEKHRRKCLNVTLLKETNGNKEISNGNERKTSVTVEKWF